MHKLFAILMVLFALGLNGQAQDAPKIEVFTGYSFMSAGFPFSTDPAAGNYFCSCVIWRRTYQGGPGH